MRYLLRGVASLVAVVVTVTAATGLTVHLLRPNKFPHDPRPLLVQLGDYLQRVFLHLDFGRSWSGSQRPVADLLAEGLPADLWLLAGGIAFGLLAGIAGGTVAAARRGTVMARFLEVVAMLFLSTPVYV